MSDLLFGAWSLPASITVFLAAAVVTVIGSVRMASLGDVLADRTGWGEAVVVLASYVPDVVVVLIF